ncbi:MAG: hypothetical protein A3D44_02180 [Candidatus Staskawiczbacteria bacterium RIFCSPHIGHO2_02_FULL_42_22]|uniref:Uncharacterized protein n=1 Tax=Candidatus Staskawiczbacteria bacterium RIFCSPHIGHO2_02_FULL_42_22 TaxID=1802207 RepID=A0A1G2I2U7_9BACT|nr:MAG: hypothetical protein A3D44_02180 [Candidatus Staskawiczbacteria bacterium RIFCSPHIGHO2_02_FULL_42_22]
MQKKNNLVKDVVIGAGIAAAVAAAAGVYFLYGSKNAAKNRKMVKGWMLKAKGEVLEKLENVKEVNEEIYHKIIDQVSKKYQAMKSVDRKDIAEFVRELKSHWQGLAKEIAAFHKAKSKGKK